MSCRYSSLDSWLSCSILWTMLCLALPVLTNFHSQQPFADLSPPCFTPPDCFLVFSHQLSLFAFANIFHGVNGAALLWKLLTQQPLPHPRFTPSHPAVGKKNKKTITAATVVVDIFWSGNFFWWIYNLYYIIFLFLLLKYITKGANTLVIKFDFEKLVSCSSNAFTKHYAYTCTAFLHFVPVFIITNSDGV